MHVQQAILFTGGANPSLVPPGWQRGERPASANRMLSSTAGALRRSVYLLAPPSEPEKSKPLGLQAYVASMGIDRRVTEVVGTLPTLMRRTVDAEADQPLLGVELNELRKKLFHDLNSPAAPSHAERMGCTHPNRA